MSFYHYFVSFWTEDHEVYLRKYGEIRVFLEDEIQLEAGSETNFIFNCKIYFWASLLNLKTLSQNYGQQEVCWLNIVQYIN